MAARILVVDDDPCMRDLLKLHLSNAGYEVRIAEDALVAGRMILSSPPELLLVDVEMPYMNGIDFVATMLADQTIPYIPVVFLTSRGDDFAAQAEALGALYLKKPCGADVVVYTVERQLVRASQAEARAGLRFPAAHAA